MSKKINVSKKIHDIGTISFPRRFGNKKFDITSEVKKITIGDYNLTTINVFIYDLTNTEYENYNKWITKYTKQPRL